MPFSCFSRSFTADHDSYLVIQFLDGHIEHIMGPCQVWYSRWKHSSIQVEQHRRYIASEKQCVVVVARDGKSERRMGPCQVTFDSLTMLSAKVEDLKRFVASQAEYMVVQYRDGSNDHLRGPQELVFEPLLHERISVEPAVRLAANEALVVYRRHNAVASALDSSAATKPGPALVAKLEVVPVASSAPGKPANGAPPLLTAEVAGQEGTMHVERRVVHGPAVFMPESSEWLHEFSWHGSIKDGKGSKTGYAGDVKVPHALNFTVIRCMPDNMYLTVRDVRSVDDANLTVHLMLFYELRSIETMLDSTNDMIGDFVNAASADVMTFASRLTYEQFLQETVELSRVANFPILSARMQQTGVNLLKVVYRGYSAADALQRMHDEAISRRTKLRLEADAARDEQEKRTMELRCRRERSVQEQELESTGAKHKISVQSLQREQDRKQKDEEQAQQLRYAQENSQMELQMEIERHNELLRREKEINALKIQQLTAERESETKKYEALQAMGVDLTAYLCALNTTRPDQHLRIDGASAPTVHIDLPKVTATGGNGLKR